MCSLSRILVASVLLLLAALSPARAQTVNVSLTPNAVMGHAGDPSFNIQSTLSNTSGSTAFINGASVNIPGLGITLDASPFLVNAPASVANGASSGPFNALTLTITGAATPGVYVGTFTVLGGADGLQMNNIGTANFTVTVLAPGQSGGSSSVPEGDGLWLFAAALPAVGLLRPRSGGAAGKAVCSGPDPPDPHEDHPGGVP